MLWLVGVDAFLERKVNLVGVETVWVSVGNTIMGTRE